MYYVSYEVRLNEAAPWQKHKAGPYETYDEASMHLRDIAGYVNVFDAKIREVVDE